MLVATTGYVAVGVCKNGPLMTDGCDYAVAWVDDKTGMVYAQDFIGTTAAFAAPTADVLMGGTNDITVVSGWQRNGVTQVVFTRPILTNDNANDVAIIAGNNYLQWAFGAPGTDLNMTTMALVEHLVDGMGTTQAQIVPTGTPLVATVAAASTLSGSVTSPHNNAVASWLVSGNSITFTVTAQTAGWISFGVCAWAPIMMGGCDLAVGNTHAHGHAHTHTHTRA